MNYPEWFIDSLVDDNDKEKARLGTLKSTDKVLFKCPNNHISLKFVHHKIDLKTGEPKRSCYYCRNRKCYPQWFIDELVNEDDKEKARNGLLSSRDRVKFKCENGHIYEQLVYNHIKLSSFSRKKGCPICKLTKLCNSYKSYRQNKRMYPKWFIDELVNTDDKDMAIFGKLTSTDKVKFKCENGHVYEQLVYNHINISSGKRNFGCPVCSSTRSSSELEVENFVKNMSYNTEHKRFRDSNNKLFEIDIFIPEKNVGIEYNGSYYHSIENERIDKYYHYNKFNECRRKDILLITIFDIEWDGRKNKIKQYIKDILYGVENGLSYNKEGYMNNNYPSWEHYKDECVRIEDSYIYRSSEIVYTCGYSKLDC